MCQGLSAISGGLWRLNDWLTSARHVWLLALAGSLGDYYPQVSLSWHLMTWVGKVYSRKHGFS